MRNRTIVSWILASCVLAAAAPAEAADPGRTVLPFLKIGVGARAASLGDAFVAVVSDASATYWNPAGLLRIANSDVEGTHNAWIQDLRHEFAAVGFHRGRHGFGASFIGFYSDDIEARDDTGAYAGLFAYSDVAFAGSYAFQLTDALGAGATVRYVRQSIDDETLSGMSFDLGGTWATPIQGLNAGAVLRHLGGQVSYDIEGAQSFDLPTTVQVGVAYTEPTFAGGGMTLSADVLAASGDDASFRVGAEYRLRESFLLGAGYKGGLDNENVSFGVGYDRGLRVHYAFTPLYDDLGNSHRISVGYAW